MKSSFAVIVLAACGGCPWTDLSPIDSTASCLTLSSTNANGGGSTGGCVDPDITGHNGCADALVIPAMDNATMTDLTFAPGADISFEVPLDVATYNHDNDDDRYEFAVDATLGTQPVTISFHAAFHGGI